MKTKSRTEQPDKPDNKIGGTPPWSEVVFRELHGFENIGLEYALNLLGVKELPGTAMQSDLFAKWIKKLSEEKGKTYVRQQSERLILQWQNIVKEFLDEHRYEGYQS